MSSVSNTLFIVFYTYASTGQARAHATCNAYTPSGDQQVKALANPPGGVRLACEAVCIMFALKPVKKNDPNTPGKKIDDYWETSQKEVLVDPAKLLVRLFEFDKDHIPDKIIQTIGPYMERDDFDPAAIKKASVACEAICLWVRAMYKYHFVAKAVEPKRQMLREAEAELAECQAKLEKAQASLREVEGCRCHLRTKRRFD